MITTQNIKNVFKIIFGKRLIYKTVNITKLAPTDLLKNRVALITGGSSGIGFSIAEAMLNAGASVVITGKNEQKLLEAFNKLKIKTEYSNKVFYEVMDNSNVSEQQNHYDKILSMLKGKTISILVNNAGTQGQCYSNFGNAAEFDYDTILDTNLKGTFFLSQIVANYMKEKKIEGNILNIASSSSLRPVNSAYTLSKWGIKGLTFGMAKLLIPYGIVVNAIAPGPTATPMLIKDGSNNINHSTNPNGRYTIPEEIANMAVVLTSGLGRSAVGSIMYMTGGSGILTYDDILYNYPK